ncbi:hypothetical protein, partial [Klebsiella quasivariicola]|uniref:hypothetical protein n=1 Tax=Klebsiella quasivariicola TaxID=2026240 RepID=UPI001D11E199
YSAIDQIAQFGLSSLKVIYYSEQLFSSGLVYWKTRNNICDEYSGLKRYGARPVSATRPVSVSLSV